MLNLFQFPSNGKAYPKLNEAQKNWAAGSVSIPFKRESVSKEIILRWGEEDYISMFQFPSNGKAYPKSAGEILKWLKLKKVSIPFKRESVSKDEKVILVMETPIGFNSLQTGKRIQSGESTYRKHQLKRFNSLQTGKRIQRIRKERKCIKIRKVSIPFKRESVSKETKKEKISVL